MTWGTRVLIGLAALVMAGGVAVGLREATDRQVKPPPPVAVTPVTISPGRFTPTAAIAITPATQGQIQQLRDQYSATKTPGLPALVPARPGDTGYTGPFDSWDQACSSVDFPFDQLPDPVTVVYAHTTDGRLVAIVSPISPAGVPFVYSAPSGVSTGPNAATAWCVDSSPFVVVASPTP
jgi:hypothetical protein